MIKVVKSRSDWQDFHSVPSRIYRNDRSYIPHLRQDIERILSKENPLAEAGDYCAWVLYDSKGPAGRIAAFYTNSKPNAGIGFFECADDIKFSNELFKTALEFLRSSKKTKVEAPVNFGERDQFWGLMVEGFSKPAYQENYNPPYYQRLFEAAGFQPGIRQTTQEVTPAEFNVARMGDLASRLLTDTEIRLEHLKLSQLKRFAADFTTVYNAAWKSHEHFVPMSEDRVLKLMKSMKPVIREDLIWFAYAGNVPIGMYISLPDVNQWFAHLNGNFNWFGKLKFLWIKKRYPVDRIRGIVFGVVPEFQGRGVTSAMMMKIFHVFEKDPNLKSTELAWVGDFNPRMLKLLKNLGARETKVHVTFERAIPQ